jgi:hypothetical protein
VFPFVTDCRKVIFHIFWIGRSHNGDGFFFLSPIVFVPGIWRSLRTEHFIEKQWNCLQSLVTESPWRKSIIEDRVAWNRLNRFVIERPPLAEDQTECHIVFDPGIQSDVTCHGN